MGNHIISYHTILLTRPYRSSYRTIQTRPTTYYLPTYHRVPWCSGFQVRVCWLLIGRRMSRFQEKKKNNRNYKMLRKLSSVVTFPLIPFTVHRSFIIHMNPRIRLCVSRLTDYLLTFKAWSLVLGPWYWCALVLFCLFFTLPYLPKLLTYLRYLHHLLT